MSKQKLNRYLISILLSNGNKVRAYSVGVSEAEALAYLQAQKQYTDYVGDADVTGIHIELTEKNIGERDGVITGYGRFLLQNSQYENHFVCVDTAFNVVVTFEQGKFNETQKVSNLHDFTEVQALQIPTALREMADWLQKYHKEKI